MSKTKNKILLLAFGVLIFSCKKSETSDVKVKADTLTTFTDSATIDNGDKPDELATSTYSTYKGAWFDIEYPANFKAENSQKSSTHSENFDSAIFTSPDGKVQFYIFSPQWSGKPTDIELKANEKMEETKAENRNGILVNRWTITAKDGSYRSSYEESSEQEGLINKIFGIKYASQQDLEKYRDEYLHFKNSLKQYAD